LNELNFLLKVFKNSSMAGLRFNFQVLAGENRISQIMHFIISPLRQSHKNFLKKKDFKNQSITN